MDSIHKEIVIGELDRLEGVAKCILMWTPYPERVSAEELFDVSVSIKVSSETIRNIIRR